VTGAPAPRRAFVFGGGGVLGYAWTLGALRAVEDVAGVEAVDSEIVIGSSAGAVLAALLSLGVTGAELARHHQGRSEPGDLAIDWDYSIAGGSKPPRPVMRPGSPPLLWDAVRHPRRVGPWLTLAAVLPVGRGSLQPVHDLITQVQQGTNDGSRPHRASTAQPWVVATDYRTGARVVFGRDHEAELADAVVASCAIPAWYAPMTIGGRQYIDGGAVSNTSCDLLLDRGLDEVYVFVPSASLQDVNRGSNKGERLERWIRGAVTRAVRAELQALVDQGTHVIAVTPTIDDLTVMGVNPMNPQPRRDVFETARRTSVPQIRAQLAGKVLLPEVSR
jgi:NTE family protein